MAKRLPAAVLKGDFFVGKYYVEFDKSIQKTN